jgi:alanine dehydrogenase
VIATGMQAKVHIVDKSEARLKQLVQMFGDKIIPEQSDKIDLNKLVAEADLLIGGVLIPGEYVDPNKIICNFFQIY